MADPRNRPAFLELLDALDADPRAEVIPASSGLFRASLGLYRKRLDKDWSLTDCVSFVVMEEKAITGALTGDTHFEQAGFTALLKYKPR